MDRRYFFKTVGAVAAALGLPVRAAEAMPTALIPPATAPHPWRWWAGHGEEIRHGDFATSREAIAYAKRRDYSDGPAELVQQYASASAIAAHTSTSNCVFLNAGKKSGSFVWVSANSATQVTADPLQGVYIAPLFDTTGASGAWVRVDAYEMGLVVPEWFGAVGDWIAHGAGAIDDRAAIQAAYAFLGSATGIYRLHLPGQYRIGSFNPALINRNALWFGTTGTTVTGGSQNDTVRGKFTLNYSAASAGQTATSFVEIHSGISIRGVSFSTNVTGTPALVFTGGVVEFSYADYVNRNVLEDFSIFIMNGTAKYGIHGLTWGSSFRDGIVSGAASHNIYITASTSDTFQNVYVNGCGGHGFYFDTAWYLSLIGCSSDWGGGAGYYSYYFGRNCRSATMSGCGAEQAYQALYVSGGCVTVDGFYFEVSRVGAANAYPIVIAGGIVTLSGLAPQNKHTTNTPFTGNATLVNVTSGTFNCLDTTVNAAQVNLTNGIAVINGLQFTSSDYISTWAYDYAVGVTQPFVFLAENPVGFSLNLGFKPPGYGYSWLANSRVALNQVFVPTTYNRFIYTCTTAGTTGATPPTLPTSPGATVKDGSVVWTASKFSTDPYGPITGFRGTGSVAFSRLSGYSGFAAQAGSIKIKHNSVPIVFKKSTFEFDFSNASTSGFVVQNTPMIVFDSCTFTAFSAMGPLFDTLSAVNSAGCATRIIFKSNCKFKGLGFVTPQSGQYLRTGNLQPMASANAGEFVVVAGGSPAVPADTYWDIGLFTLRETGVAAGGYIGDVCVRSGYAAKATWTASTACVAGATVVPTSDNGYVYQCTTAGTTGSTQPSWPTSLGATVTDGSVVWTEAGPAALFKPYGAIST